MKKNIRKLSDALLLPELIQLQSNLYALIFRIMKLLPAKHIIAEALKRGDIKNGCTIVETSSGTFALGLGIICAELKIPFKIFSDPAMDEQLIARIEDLGGSVHISNNPSVKGAYQKLRLEALHDYLNKNQLSYWTQQYDNLDNTHAYQAAAERLLDDLGMNINIVGTVGSGGSTAGMIKPIRDVNPSAQLIGVDTFNSVLFGLENGPRELRGLGNTIIPKNLNHGLYDEIHWVSANDAYYYTRRLHQDYALYCGPTSGAAYQVAAYLATQIPNETFVFIAPDEGHRYAASTYSNNWLSQQDFFSTQITIQPTTVTTPMDAKPAWSCMKWDRRTDIIKKTENANG